MKKFSLIIAMLVAMVFTVSAQQIKGTIKDNLDGTPLVGASVVAKGTTTGSVTDVNGAFEFTLPNGATTLVVSFVGYVNKEVAINGQTTIDVIMDSDANILGDVVVVGYGTSVKTRTVGSVSTISGKNLDQIPFGSLDNMLQGQTTGVQVTGLNGRPGQRAFIRVRGTGSITAGRDPLYVVDGIPLSGDFYSLINANDIDNISVLKDAASASIYGSRGSNGVVLVTTKKGNKKRQPELQFRYQRGIKRITPYNFDLMSQSDKLKYEYDLGFLNKPLEDSIKVAYPTPAITTNAAALAKFKTLTDDERGKIWNSLSNTDWLKTLTRQANLSSYELNIRGGSDNFGYYFSLNNYDEEGISKGSTFNRKSALINVQYSPVSWFTLGNMTNISVAKNDQLRDRNNAQSPFRAMFSYNSYEPEKLANGDWNLTHQGFSISEAVLNNVENDITIGGVSNIYGEFKPMADLKIRSSLGINFRDFQREYYLKPGSILDQFVGDPAAPGSKTDNGNREVNYVLSNTVNYTKELNKNHRIDLLGGVEYTENNFKSYSLQSKGYPTDKVSTQNNGAAAVATTSNRFDWALFSLLGRASYSYLDKYAVEASLRNDGSSRFGSQNRQGTFWSVGAGWNIAREKFMGMSQESILKIRAAAGTSGNFEIGNYPWQDLYALNVSYGDRTASAPSQLGNPELTWEKNFNWSTGIEYEFFKSRLKGYVEFYNKKTFDLIFTTPVSQTTGFATVLKNIGDIQNQGVEVNVNYDLISVPSKRLKLNVGLNYTFNANKVTKLFNGKEVDGLGGITRLKEGYPVYNYYMPRWAGTDPDDGGHRWLDTLGNTVKTYSAGNSVILDGKSPDPTYYGNFRTTLEYQGFSISANLYYSGGNYVQNFIWSTLNSDGANARSAQAADALNYWKQKGDVNVSPKPILNGGQTNWTSDRFLQKGDFIRLRNVTVAYEIPEKALKSLKMKSVRVYFQGQNIWTWAKDYKGDPEVGLGSGEGGAAATYGGIQSLFSYPQTLGFTGGIDVTF